MGPRERKQTPLYRGWPWMEISYPVDSRSANGNFPSSTLVSWIATRSGCAESSHSISRGIRARMELTLKVAIRMGSGYLGGGE